MYFIKIIIIIKKKIKIIKIIIVYIITFFALLGRKTSLTLKIINREYDAFSSIVSRIC